MKKVLLFLLIVISLVACNETTKYKEPETYPDGEYKTFSTMLNHCKGVTIVVGVSKMSGRVSYAIVDIVVIDATNKMYTCSTGGTLGLQKGDTVKY